MIAILSKKPVVDRGGFSYSSCVNTLAMANPNFRYTELRHLPNVMANLFGLKRDANLAPALNITMIGASHV